MASRRTAEDAYYAGIYDGELYKEIVRIDPEKPFEFNGISYDPIDGVGAVGYSSNINYMGWTSWMTPAFFHLVNPPRERSTDSLFAYLGTGVPIGPPILYVTWEDDAWRVTGHEGRGRSLWISSMTSDHDIYPVHVKPTGPDYEIRAHDLTIEQALAKIRPDDRGGIAFARSKAITLNLEVTMNPYPWVYEFEDSYEAGFREGSR